MRFLPSMLLAISVVIAVSSINPASAQLIRINNNGFGGVNIRAPFVRVNTSPYGTHVRAPFVEVNSPPGRYYQPPYYAPAQPYYRPVPGQPYYQAPPVPGSVMRPPNQSPRFNPTRPGQQVRAYGVAPGVATGVAPGVATGVAPRVAPRVAPAAVPEIGHRRRPIANRDFSRHKNQRIALKRERSQSRQPAFHLSHRAALKRKRPRIVN